MFNVTLLIVARLVMRVPKLSAFSVLQDILVFIFVSAFSDLFATATGGNSQFKVYQSAYQFPFNSLPPPGSVAIRISGKVYHSSSASRMDRYCRASDLVEIT